VDTENILIPFCEHSSDLKPLYHAFALAERIRAKIFVLFFKNKARASNRVSLLEEACIDMVNRACEGGMSVSFHVTMDDFEEELLNIIKTEHIDLIVTGPGDTEMGSAIRGIKPKLVIQIIEVKGKNNINSNEQR